MSTNFTRVFLSFSFIVLLSCGCGKLSHPQEDEHGLIEMSEMEGQQAFAIILSRAVASESSLRSFIKKEALKEFDLDHDVFYPFVKNQILDNGDTFREAILRHSESEEQLSQIERSVPKLTILVPDYSWIKEQCFSVYSWDTNLDRVAVGYDDRQETHPIYYNGEKIGDLPAFSFPTFPVLIVKSNERMVVSESATKAGGISYDFLDSAFDGTKTTKGHLEGPLLNYWDDSYNLVKDQNDLISCSDMNLISPETVIAYNTFGTGWNGGVQRDYIYYGMSQTNTNNGSLNLFERELIYRFSLPVNGLLMVADNVYDPQLNTMVLYTEKGYRPNINEAIQRMWGNGNFEFRIESYVGSRSGGAFTAGQHVLSINPHDLLYISEGYYTFDWTWFNNWGSYTVSTDHFLPKWYYPLQHNQFLVINNNWNLLSTSDNLRIVVTEVDAQTTTTTSETTGFKYTDSVTATTSGEANAYGVKIGLGVSGTYGNEATVSTNYSVTRTDGADDMGMIIVEYVDNVILSEDNENRYILKRFQTGCFDICLIPVDTRRETIIRGVGNN